MVVSKNIILFAIVSICLSVLFNLSSIVNILIGVYKWHAVQPETIEGIVELIAFCLLIFLSLKCISKSYWSIICTLFLICIYFQLHQVFLPATLSLLFFEVIITIGLFVLKNLQGFKPKLNLKTYIVSFLIGFVTWALVALIMSLIGFGGFVELRVMTVILALLSLYYTRHLPLSLYIAQKIHSTTTYEKIGYVFTLFVILTQFAKTNRALDYDSIWYGLRPEKVLVGSHSFFDNLGMTMVVHFYPKLFELFTLPLGNLGDYSFILSANVMFFIFILIVIFLFARKISGSDKRALFIVTLLCCVPAISNMASTAKTDIFSVFFIGGCAYFLWEWLDTRDSYYFCLAVGCGLLSLGGKITSLMYIPLLFFGFLLAYFITKGKLFNLHTHVKNSLFFVSGASVVTLLICYRTFKLTGYPFYPILGGLWNLLGFSSKYPFPEANNDFILSDDKNMLTHWYKIIFDPEGYTHYVMVWPSNLYFYLLLISVVLLIMFRKQINKNSLMLYVAFMPIIISGIYNIISFPQGGDGNYYIPVIIFITLAFLKFTNNLKVEYRKILILSLLIFIPVQSGIMFVSHFSWSWGTDRINFDLTKTNFESYSQNQKLFKEEGILEIEEYLSSQNKYDNAIGFLWRDGQEQVLNRLSARFEDIPHINSRYGNSNLFINEHEFKKYLEWANIKYIIMPKTDIEGFDEVKNFIFTLEQTPNVIRVDSEKFYLLDISNVDVSQVTTDTSKITYSKYLDGWYSKENGYRWINAEAKGIFKSGENGELVIEGIVPDVFDSINFSIEVNGEIVGNWNLQPGDFKVSLDGLPLNKEMNITLKSDKFFVPKNMNINEDTRELSLVIKQFILK